MAGSEQAGLSPYGMGNDRVLNYRYSHTYRINGITAQGRGACAVALGYGIKTYSRPVIYAIMPPYEVRIAQIMIVSICSHHNMLWWTPYCTIGRARLYGTVV